MKLKEIIEISSQELDYAAAAQKGDFIISGYNTDYRRCQINASNIETRTAKGHPLPNHCLLAYYQKKMHVAKYDKAAIAKNSQTYAFIGHIWFKNKRQDIITDDYLLRSICSQDVDQQIKALNEKVYYGISVDGFLSLEINIPPIEEQETTLKQETQSLLKEQEKELSQTYEEYQKDVHLKKHAIGQTLFNLNNWWNTLQKARKDNLGQLNDKTETGSCRKIRVADIFDKVEQSLTILSNQVNTFTLGDGMEPEEFALSPFIDDYISNHQNTLFRYETENKEEAEYAPWLYGIEYGGNHYDAIIKFPRKALTTILDNIVNNACVHGFAERPNQDNKIKIKMEGSKQSILTLTIENNGAPIHKDMTKEKILAYGATTEVGKHSGLGAYQIKVLMDKFGGKSLEIESHPDREYTVAYILKFANHGTNILI